MTQNPFGQQQGQTHQNMQTGNVSQQMNHGGHEVFDLHETLSETIAALNQAVLLRPHVKDPELLCYVRSPISIYLRRIQHNCRGI